MTKKRLWVHCLLVRKDNTYNLLQYEYMTMQKKVKRVKIKDKYKNKLISHYNEEGEEVKDLYEEEEYYINSIFTKNKWYMKLFTNREIYLKVHKDMSLIEKELLLNIYMYVDSNNKICFKDLRLDCGYAESKLSKAKRWLVDKWIIRKDDRMDFYLNPILWILWVSTDKTATKLISLFEDTFKQYLNGYDSNKEWLIPKP